ncbi:MAG: hypothetical protein AAB610_02410 [Patescibacteria group bacterium]
MKTKIIQNLKAIILGLIITIGMGYAVAGFSGPSCAPPGCNADAPINASSTPQIKSGPLTVGGLGIVGNFTFLPSVGATVANGSILVADGTNTGKVKWVAQNIESSDEIFTLSDSQKTKSNTTNNALRIDATTLCSDSDGCEITAYGNASNGTQIPFLPTVLISHEMMYPSYDVSNGNIINWSRPFNNWYAVCNAGFTAKCNYDFSSYQWYFYNYDPITAAAPAESNPFVFWLSMSKGITAKVLIED